MSTALLLDTNLLNLVPVIIYVPAKFFELGLIISGSEAVVLYLASGSEDHEQEFDHHWGNTLLSSTVLFLFVHPSCLRIICVTFLLGAVIELNRLHTYRAGPFL